jgi:diaminopimelate epimerase
MRFEKWQALGNDYLIVEREQLPFELTPARVRRLCAGHFGVGGDGVLELSQPDEGTAGGRFVARLRIFNPDGSEAELSGNGAREAVLYLRARGWTDHDEFSIQTLAGEIRPTVTGPDTCRIDMGRAKLTSKDFPHGPPDGRSELHAAGHNWRFRHVSVGNPQCAIAVEDADSLEALDLSAIGPPIEGHELFPSRTNVSWYAEVEPGRVRARIFERGVGETLSSGTGACGAAVAYALRLRDEAPSSTRAADGAPTGDVVTVVLDGGELEVAVDDDLRIDLTGWARPVFEGRLSEELARELEEIQ